MSRWSSIFLGAVTAVAVSAMLLCLGMGLGLSIVPLEKMDEPQLLGMTLSSGLFAIFALSFSAFVGGFVAVRSWESRTNEPPNKLQGRFQALGMWGLILTLEAAMAGVIALPLFVSAAGVSSAGVGAVALWEEVRKANPRIVTDLSLIQGKAVTTIGIDGKTTLPQILANAQKNADEILNDDKSQKTARQAFAGFALLGFFISLGTLLCSLWGASVAPVLFKERTRVHNESILHSFKGTDSPRSSLS